MGSQSAANIVLESLSRSSPTSVAQHVYDVGKHSASSSTDAQNDGDRNGRSVTNNNTQFTASLRPGHGRDVPGHAEKIVRQHGTLQEDTTVPIDPHAQHTTIQPIHVRQPNCSIGTNVEPTRRYVFAKCEHDEPIKHVLEGRWCYGNSERGIISCTRVLK